GGGCGPPAGSAHRAPGPVLLYDPRGAGQAIEPTEPPRAQPIFCQGWYGNTGSGRYMSETHAPFWVYGSGELRLRFARSQLPRRVTVEGRATHRLHGRGWQLVTVDAPRLVSCARATPGRRTRRRAARPPSVARRCRRHDRCPRLPRLPWALGPPDS